MLILLRDDDTNEQKTKLNYCNGGRIKEQKKWTARSLQKEYNNITQILISKNKKLTHQNSYNEDKNERTLTQIR